MTGSERRRINPNKGLVKIFERNLDMIVSRFLYPHPSRVWTRDGETRAPGAAFDAPSGDELGALDALGAKGTWTFQGRELALTNLDKVLFPPRGREAPVTKREFIRYYVSIAPTLSNVRGVGYRLRTEVSAVTEV